MGAETGDGGTVIFEEAEMILVYCMSASEEDVFSTRKMKDTTAF